MGRRTPKAWHLWLVSLGLVGCQGSDAASRLDPILDPPASCGPSEPFCYQISVFPDEGDLFDIDSSNIRFNDNTLMMSPGGGLPDSDFDGVPDSADDCAGPGWRDFGATCDGSPNNDGDYFTLYYDVTTPQSLTYTNGGPLPSALNKVDVYFLLDASSTMDGEITNMVNNLGGLVFGIRSKFPFAAEDDVQFGLGIYREYGLDPFADTGSQTPYHHILDITADLSDIAFAFLSLDTVANASLGTSATQAMFSVATGQGLSWFVPNRKFCPDTDREGYPCFRPDALRIIVNVTDQRPYDGPDVTGPTYFIGSQGAQYLPQVEMYPDLLFADSAASALNLGDLGNPPRALTLMGMSTFLLNQVDTSSMTGCGACGGMGCDEDWRDAVVKFHFSSLTDPTPWIWAYANNTHFGANLAFFDETAAPGLAAGDELQCDYGAAYGNNWGEIYLEEGVTGPDPAITTGVEYYLALDGLIPAADPGATPQGAFQLTIWPEDVYNDIFFFAPVNRTRAAPVSWAVSSTAMVFDGVQVASVVTDTDPDAEQDAIDIAYATGAEDALGDPYVKTADADGTGVAQAMVDLFDQISTGTKRDVSVVLEDDPLTVEDERNFVDASLNCPTTGPATCSGGTGTTTCTDCDPGAPVTVSAVFANDFVPPTASDQVFDFGVDIQIDGISVYNVPFRVLVPANTSTPFGGSEGTLTPNDIDSSATGFCNIPNERPRWGDLEWTGTYSSDATIEFQFRTANSFDDLDTATPTSVVIPTHTTDNPFDWNDYIPFNGLAYARVTAVLNPSSDGLTTPTLDGWTFRFDCIPDL